MEPSEKTADPVKWGHYLRKIPSSKRFPSSKRPDSLFYEANGFSRAGLFNPACIFGRAFLMATRWAWRFHQEETPFPMPAGNRERPPHLMRLKTLRGGRPFSEKTPRFP